MVGYIVVVNQIAFASADYAFVAFAVADASTVAGSYSYVAADNSSNNSSVAADSYSYSDYM